MRDDYYIDEYGYYRYNNSGRLVHRHIAEKYVVGHRLRYDEVVHHKNRNKLDNRPQNLEVMTQDEHEALHRRERGLHYVFQSTGGASFVTLVKIILFILTFPLSLIVVIIWYFLFRDASE